MNPGGFRRQRIAPAEGGGQGMPNAALETLVQVRWFAHRSVGDQGLGQGLQMGAGLLAFLMTGAEPLDGLAIDKEGNSRMAILGGGHPGDGMAMKFKMGIDGHFGFPVRFDKKSILKSLEYRRQPI